MSDADRRRLERAWEANPGDQETLHAYIAARRRSGLHVGLDLLEQRVFPACELAAPPSGAVIEVLDPKQDKVHRVEGAEGERLQLPAYSYLWVEAKIDAPSELQALAEYLQDYPPHVLTLKGSFDATALAPLARVRGLESLRLRADRIAGDLSAGLGPGPPLLHTLMIWDSADLRPLELQAALLDLSLYDCAPTPEFYDALEASSLEALELSDVPLSDGVLERLDGPRLRRLELHGFQGFEVHDRHLDRIASLSHLRTLALSLRMRITDEGFASLARLSRLEELRLGLSLGISVRGLQAIAPLPLKELSLGGDSLTGACLGSLPAGLKRLHLAASITDADVHALQRLEQLEELWLNDPSLSDDGVRDLLRLPALRELSLSCLQRYDGSPQFTDSTAGVVATSGVRWLGCHGWGLTDQGIELLRDSAVQELWIDLCEGVSREALLSWKQARPGRKVRHELEAI